MSAHLSKTKYAQFSESTLSRFPKPSRAFSSEAIIFLGLRIMFFRQNLLLSQEKSLENTTFHYCLAYLLKIRFDTFHCRYARAYWRTDLRFCQRTAGHSSWVILRVNKTNKSSSKFAGHERFTVKVWS